MSVFDHLNSINMSRCISFTTRRPASRRSSLFIPRHSARLPAAAGAGNTRTTRCADRCTAAFARHDLQERRGRAQVRRRQVRHPGQRRAPKSPELVPRFRSRVESLGGRYVTAEDVGCSVEDMRYVKRKPTTFPGCPRVATARWRPVAHDGAGRFPGHQAAVEARLGRIRWRASRRRTGCRPCWPASLPTAARRRRTTACCRCQSRQPAARSRRIAGTEVAPHELLFSDVDVLAPCALGQHPDVADNSEDQGEDHRRRRQQPACDRADGARLAERDILYAPDYVINAGGIINVAHEYYGDSSEDEVRAEVAKIPERSSNFRRSERQGEPTN